MTVRGPGTDIIVRRKERVLGVWLNGANVTFHNAPSYFATAANRPLTEIAPPETLARHNIGLENVPLEPIGEDAARPDLGQFREALLANQTRAALYHGGFSHISFLGEHLFRVDMNFPATLPTGNYSVEVLLVAGGQVVAAQTTPLIVSRIGFSNGVFRAAHRHAVLYGAGALAFAVAAGWAASAIFRRV